MSNDPIFRHLPPLLLRFFKFCTLETFTEMKKCAKFGSQIVSLFCIISLKLLMGKNNNNYVSSRFDEEFKNTVRISLEATQILENKA